MYLFGLDTDGIAIFNGGGAVNPGDDMLEA